MNQESIFIPFFGMMLLTIIVWIYMYVLRLPYLLREKVDLQSVATSKQMHDALPDRINLPSENLVNLFELPVLFYAVCIYLFLSQQVDTLYLGLAYGFLVFRAGHSLVHCKSNNIMRRFYLYILSSVILWVMIFRALTGVLMTN